jgi:hypothetical protein
MYAIFFALLIALFSGCSPRYSDFYPYYDNGTKKPSLTLLPMIDEAKNPLAANLAPQLSKAVRNRIKRVGKMYIPPPEKMQNALRVVSLKELAATHNLKQFLAFQGSDFVVVTELSEFQVVPYKRGQIKPLYIQNLDPREAKVLMMAVRLKIIQLSGKEPRVVRQELVRSNHMLSLQQVASLSKGDEDTIDMVRSRLSRDLAEKIEETICVRQ